MQTETGAEIESSAQLQSGQLVRLMPGRVTTDERRWYFVTFTVPPGWYGHERRGNFTIGKELSGEAVAFSSGGISVPSGGISVGVLDFSVARAARRLEKVSGLRVHDVSQVRIGGYAGRKYGLVLDAAAPLSDVLGVAGALQAGELDVILLGLPDVTLLIRRGFDSDQERAEIERVLRSFTFPRSAPPKKELERISKKWAVVFARRPGTCRYLGSQPLCERTNCVRAGGLKIPNCTLPSSEFRKSFEGATVEAVAIKGDRAAVRFSNGAAIVLGRHMGSWSIERLGGNAGREFFK